jgi:hypothetical protein
VILAEDDAAEFQPSLVVQVIPDRPQLRIIVHAVQGGDQAFERRPLRVGLDRKFSLGVFRFFIDLTSRKQGGRGIETGHAA